MKRDYKKMRVYRRVIGRCCYPGCEHTSVEVHHIIPLQWSGEDCYSNYICLCHDHHTRGKYHRFLHDTNWEEKARKLFEFKYFAELLILGFVIDMPDWEFLEILASMKSAEKMEKFNG